MTTPFTITMEKLNEHQLKAKKLQVMLLTQLTDSTNGKKGIDEILELARWSSALGGLTNYISRMLSAKQETLKMQGTEITVGEDVPIEMVQQIMSLSVARPAKVGVDVSMDVGDSDPEPDEPDESDSEE